MNPFLSLIHISTLLKAWVEEVPPPEAPAVARQPTDL